MQVARKFEQSDAEGELLRAGARDPHAQQWPGGGASAPVSTALDPVLDPVLSTLPPATDRAEAQGGGATTETELEASGFTDAAVFMGAVGQSRDAEEVAAAEATIVDEAARGGGGGGGGRFEEAGSEQSHSQTGACGFNVRVLVKGLGRLPLSGATRGQVLWV